MGKLEEPAHVHLFKYTSQLLHFCEELHWEKYPEVNFICYCINQTWLNLNCSQNFYHAAILKPLSLRQKDYVYKFIKKNLTYN